MDNFEYCNPTRVFFGKGQIAAIDTQIPREAKVLLTYGGGSIKRNGTYAQVKAALGGREVVEFGGIEPNPAFETMLKGVALARAEKVDFVLAVGGGSVVDGSKFLSGAVFYEGDPWEIVLTRASVVKKTLPLGAVLTLPATGTEMNGNAVVTRRATKDKLGMANPLFFPRFSVLDPELTYSLPPRQIANGVVDAFVHVMEQYMTYPARGSVQDRFAEGVLLTLIEEGPKTLAHPTDYDSRANMMWAASMALCGILRVGMPGDWASHGIGHELTALYGMDHGQTLAVVLPGVLAEYRAAKHDKLLQYARRVWGESGSDEAAVDGAIARTRAFFESLGVKTTLAGYGLGAEAIPAVVEQLRRHNRLTLGEGDMIDLGGVTRILKRCL